MQVGHDFYTKYLINKEKSYVKCDPVEKKWKYFGTVEVAFVGSHIPVNLIRRDRRGK